MKLTLFPQYGIGETVYHTHGDMPGVVTSLLVKSNDMITYGVSWGDRRDSWHFECELRATQSFSNAASESQ